MFASQLLRILQTLPANVKNEPCASDTAELKVRMKESQNGIVRQSDGYFEEADRLSFATKDLLQSNGHGKDADPLVLRRAKMDYFSNTLELEQSAVLDELTKDAETDSKVSLTKKDQSRLLYHLSGDAHLLTSDREDRDKFWNTPERECLAIMDEFPYHNKHETRDSGGQFNTSSELVRAEKHLDIDKSGPEHDLPELIVCYKEINYHVVKDICIDDRMQVEDKASSDKHADAGAELSLRLPSDEHGSRGSSNDYIDGHAADECGIKKKRSHSSPASGESKCSPEGRVNRDDGSLKESVQDGQRKYDASVKVENDGLVEESIVTRMLPLKQFGTRSFLRSFMDSLNNHDDAVVQQSNQIVEAKLQSVDAESEDEEENRDGSENDLLYSSKIESGTITFDFNSAETAAVDSRGTTGETDEESLKLDIILNAADLVGHADDNESSDSVHQESVIDSEYRYCNNPFIVSDVQRFRVDACTENIGPETVINSKNGHSNNPFAISDVPSAGMGESTENIHQTAQLNHKTRNFNPSAFRETETVSTDKSTKNDQPPMLHTEKGKTNNPFAVSEDGGHQPPALNQEIPRTSNPFTVSILNIHQEPETNQKTENSNNPFASSEIEGAMSHDSIGNIYEKPEDLDGITNHRHSTDNSSSVPGNTQMLNLQSFESPSLPFHEGTSSNVIVTDQFPGGEGESCFSAADPVSGRITFSGPITFSGSTSLRSDSSTTSTRSFAFPVLQAEWNSSPVRMRKADGRHFRKPRGWMQGILCCRF